MTIIKTNKPYILIVILLQITLYISAQESTYKHYGIDDGMQSSEVYHAFQDSKGYVWFATDMGVSRFNGYEFKNFGIEDGLSNNTVFEVFEDSHGKIWFISLLNKLSYFYNDTIIEYKYNYLIQKHSQNNVTSIKNSFFVDSLDNVYFSVREKGLCKISNKGKFTDIQENDINTTLRIVPFSNKLIIGYKYQNNDSEQIIYNNSLISNYPINKSHKFNHSSHFFSVYGNDNNSILLSYYNELFKIKSDKLIKIKSFENNIIWFSKDKFGRYWVSLRDGGVICYLDSSFSEKTSRRFLNNKDISSVLIDNDNGYWFTTLNNSVYYLPTYELRVIKESVNKNIHSVSVNSQNVIAVTLKPELLIFNRNYEFINKIKTKPTNLATKLKYDPNTDIQWVATNDFISKVKANDLKHIKTLKPYTKLEGKRSVKAIAFSPPKSVWLGFNRGLLKFRDDKLVYVSSKSDSWNELTYSIIANPDGSLWLGTLLGLWKYKNGEYISFGNKNKLFKQRINALLKYQNKLLIGTKGEGLQILDLYTNKAYTINTLNGLTSNSVTSLENYKDKIYIATNKGINILDISDYNNFEITQVDKGDGLLSDEVNELDIYDSILYIASKKGINYINLNNYNQQNKLLNTYIENVKIITKDTIVKQTYKLEYTQNFINISYRALSFKNNKHTLYRYKMYPIVTKWIYTNKNELQFTELQPGIYTFIVSAKNKSGIWNNSNASVKFIINKPFWYKWWFIALSVAIAILIVIFVINNKLNNVQKENKLKKELNMYMKKAINSQINPHFLFNSLNSINQYILKNDKINSSKYLNRFSNYIRSVLNALKNDYLSLSEELKIAELYLELEKFRLKEKLSYSIEIDKTVKLGHILIPGMIIIPFIENAIWFGILPKKGELGKIEVYLSQKENILTITIKDNGIGRKASIEQKNKTEFSLKKPSSEDAIERIRLINQLHSGSIDIKYTDLFSNDKALGTIVDINIKIS